MIERYHVLLGLVALAIGTALAVVDRRGPAVFRDRVAGLVLSAASLLTVIVGVARWFPWMIVAAGAVAPADDGQPPHPLGRWAWVAALASLAGIWSAVPDTEPALAAAACLLPVAVVRWIADAAPGPVGTGLLIALVVGAAWVGAAQRVPALSTAVAVGAVVIAPLLLGYRRSLAGRGLALVVVVHVAVALVAPRLLVVRSASDALGGAVAVAAFVAVAVLVGGAWSPDPSAPGPGERA